MTRVERDVVKAGMALERGLEHEVDWVLRRRIRRAMRLVGGETTLVQRLEVLMQKGRGR